MKNPENSAVHEAFRKRLEASGLKIKWKTSVSGNCEVQIGGLPVKTKVISGQGPEVSNVRPGEYRILLKQEKNGVRIIGADESLIEAIKMFRGEKTPSLVHHEITGSPFKNFMIVLSGDERKGTKKSPTHSEGLNSRNGIFVKAEYWHEGNVVIALSTTDNKTKIREWDGSIKIVDSKTLSPITDRNKIGIKASYENLESVISFVVDRQNQRQDLKFIARAINKKLQEEVSRWKNFGDEWSTQ